MGVRLGLSVLTSLDLAARHPCDERGGAEEENFRNPSTASPCLMATRQGQV